MISKRLEDAINAQINAEYWSAYLYLSMSAYCQDKGYAGMANWFAIQFKEEQDHAQIFYNYLISRGGRVLLKAIDAVETEWASPLTAFEACLDDNVCCRFAMQPIGHFGQPEWGDIFIGQDEDF